MKQINNIRNFCIIAHIDHGKSTLSDKLIEACSVISIKNNFLDSMELEKEKGITIKARNITLYYIYKKIKYKFNLIDTPGHSDFSNEVIRSLIACQGAILLIDVTKGIQAQTIANYNLAKKLNLIIIIVFNKIDLLKYNFNKLTLDLKNILDININNNKPILCSAKKGIGINLLIKNIIKLIPCPKGNINNILEAIILDTWFDSYKGIVCLICIKEGYIKKLDYIKIIELNKNYQVKNIGLFTPQKIEVNKLICGEIGWLIWGKKEFNINPVGYTITSINNNKKFNKNFLSLKIPQIYNSIFPIDNKDFNLLKNSIKKLHLNDSSFTYELINSNLLGYGYKCGFLGLLHMEIIKERLEREYKLNLFITLPTVYYKIKLNKNENLKSIDENFQFITLKNIKNIYEPIAECIIIIPINYLNEVIKLCNNKRGINIKTNYYNNKIILIYEIPLNELIINFISQLQSITHGYASLKYNFKFYKISNISILEILINKLKIEYFRYFIHKSKINYYSKNLLKIFKENIPKQLFEISIQIQVNNSIIASTTIKPYKKNVISKCYGGDVTRKKKLLQKQKIGKKKMKKLGKIFIPKDIFFKINNIQ